MRNLLIHNPCNEITRRYRDYNLFWDDLTEELKKKSTPKKGHAKKKMVESHEKRKLKFIFFALLKNWLNLMKIRKQRKKSPCPITRINILKEDIVYFT
jgi:hypothetical protein